VEFAERTQAIIEFIITKNRDDDRLLHTFDEFQFVHGIPAKSEAS
jgi:hypothetical protein